MPDKRQPNLALRRLVDEYQFTHDSLADEVCATALRLTGVPVACSGRQVRRWLSGAISWPWGRYRAPLESIFGRPATELGFMPPASSDRGSVRASTFTAPREMPVLRRQFVLGLTGTMLSLPSLPESGRLGMSDVDRIQTAAAQLHQLDDLHGGEQLADVATRYIGHVEASARRCTYGGNVQTYLHRTLGEMAGSAGWFAYDAGLHDQARQWWDTGLRYALLARDPMLQARIWSYMSRQAIDLGHASEAVAIARAALDATRGRRDPRLSALLHARVALGHAAQGEPGRSGQSLLRGEQQLDRARDGVAPWLAFFTPAELLAQASMCHDRLGSYSRAVELRREVLGLRGPAFQRNRFSDRVHLAECLLSAGSPAEAATVGGDALELLPAVHSPRWSVRLGALRDRLQEAPEGAVFVHHYDRVIAGQDGAGP